MGKRTRDEEGRVGNRLEQLRNEAGISRAELAEMVGVHYQTIGYIERFEYSPSLVLAFRLTEALGTTVENLFYLEGDY